LSQHHFEHYFESKGIKDARNFIERDNWFKFKAFEKDVKEDWFKRLSEK
jgi:hypothetical protein